MGNLQRSSATGNLLKHDTTGNLMNVCCCELPVYTGRINIHLSLFQHPLGGSESTSETDYTGYYAASSGVWAPLWHTGGAPVGGLVFACGNESTDGWVIQLQDQAYFDYEGPPSSDYRVAMSRDASGIPNGTYVWFKHSPAPNQSHTTHRWTVTLGPPL